MKWVNIQQGYGNEALINLSPNEIGYLNHKHILNIESSKKRRIEEIDFTETYLESGLEKELINIIKKSKQPIFWESYLAMIKLTKHFFLKTKNQEYINPEYVVIKLAELLRLLEDKGDFFEHAYSIAGYEDTLYRHTVNVSILAYLAAQSKTLLEKPLLLAQMGFFHDIGKVTLDESILNKPGALTEEERKYVQSHTFKGVELLKKMNVSINELFDAALLHHELRNGKGYPFGFQTDRLSVPVQIISLVDSFDTICSDRSYKSRKSIFEAFNELFKDAVMNKLNPLIVFPFIENALSCFINRTVILSNGESGLLYHVNSRNIIYPIIQLDNGHFLDMSKSKDVFITNFIEKEHD